ncbi:MAG: fibronectin type III domain-containing protein [Candidatus Eisenbacteria bacterium]
MHTQRFHGRWRKEQIRRAVLVAAALLLLGLAPVIARAQGAGTDTLTLAWTAPGDDGTIGRATSYDIRWSTAPISDANFTSANAVTGPPAPANSGARQQVVVRGLSRGTTYYFALKTTDDAGNVSPLSNIVQWDWVYDTSPPAQPTGLTATVTGGGSSVHVHWNANSEPDLGGYKIYRSSAGSGGPWSRADGPGLTATNDFVDGTLPVGVNQLWYKISAVDISGNESARTNPVSVMLSGSGGVQAAGMWGLDPVYPNPSRIGGPVTLPVSVGGGSGSIEITDAGRRLIRHIDLSSLAAGRQNVNWDGLNDAGRPVAPGFYTVWIVGGGSRQSVKMVRVP